MFHVILHLSVSVMTLPIWLIGNNGGLHIIRKIVFNQIQCVPKRSLSWNTIGSTICAHVRDLPQLIFLRPWKFGFCLTLNYLSISIKSISYLLRRDSIYTCGYHSTANFLWSNLIHWLLLMVTIESYLRAYNCPSSNVKQFQLWRKWSMYKARLDMKSHKNILHQTHMLFQRPWQWCC